MKITIAFLALFLSLIISSSNPVLAFDPRDFLVINKKQIPFDDHFFDRTINLLKLKQLEEVSLDDTDATSNVKFSISVQGITKALFNSHDSIFIYEYDCGYGLIVTKRVSSNGSNSNKDEIEIKGLHIGMRKEDVQKALTLGKVEAGYFGKTENNKKKHLGVWYSHIDKSRSNGFDRTISVSSYFDDEGKLIKFEIVMSDC
jgi:hypothetical protein